MRLQNREKIFILVLFSALLLLLAAATMMDRALSLSAANTENVFGRFLEIWAEPPSLLMVAFSFALCAVYRARLRTPYFVLQTALCTLGCVIAVAATVYRTADYYTGEGVSSPAVLAIVAAVSLLLVFLCLFLSTRIRTDTLSKMFPAMLFVIATALATLFIVSTMKNLWGRIRFRDMAALGDDTLSGFVPWYLPQGITGYNSFPSGHTSNAVILFSASYYVDAIRPKRARLIRILVILWIAVVMVSRILCGAHFLSDVVCGALITSVITLCAKLWVYQPALEKQL